MTLLRNFLVAITRWLHQAAQWLNAQTEESITTLLNRIFRIDRATGLQRLYLRDLGLLLTAVWIWARHWDVVGHPLGLGLLEGSWIAKLLGVLLVLLPIHVIRVALVFFYADSVLIWLPMILAYQLGLYVASRYLEDVYEISDALKSKKEGLRVARRFLTQAAFAQHYSRVRERKDWVCRLHFFLRPILCPTNEECLHWRRSHRYGKQKISWARRIWDFIRGAPVGCPHTLAVVEGEVKDRQSPLLLIGGPGYAFIAADNAVLFEKPDGTDEVLGPTIKRLHSLEGFERIRRIVSLRDHQTSLSITARSRDGIPIHIDDVQILFAIYRGNRQPDREHPFPFEPEALRRLVYREPALHLEDRWAHFSSSRLLTTTMRNMARQELTAFIRSQTVLEFLASVTPLDLEALLQEGAEPDLLPNAPQFIWRPQISQRFDSMANGPNGEKAQARGVGLRWVGLGAWRTPVDHIIEEHEEAWQLSMRNLLRANPVVLRQIAHRRYLSAFGEFVRELLAEAYRYETTPPRQRQIALLAYFAYRLNFAVQRVFGDWEQAPPRWREARNCLNSVSSREVGPIDPPPPLPDPNR